MRLKRLKYTDLLEDKKYNFIVPIGALEQHGPFAPFGTDTYIVDYLVDKAENEIPDLIVVPTLEFSRSQEHRGFFGTIYLKEETLKCVLFDICNSLYSRAENIFIVSFHHNDPYIQKFIEESTGSFGSAKISFIEIFNDEDEVQIVELLDGPVDGHAGNTEISNMLVIEELTVLLPTESDKKHFIEEAFLTDNIAEKSQNGIDDNHPEWKVNKEIGQKVLNIYSNRLNKNIRDFLK